MAVQVAGLLEALAADAAGIGPLVHVGRGYVDLQVGLAHEGRLADVALEGPKVRVDRQVVLEDVAVLEALLAEVTLERALVVVDLFVDSQVGQLLEHLGADLALVGAAVLVCGAHVAAQRVGQRVAGNYCFGFLVV